MAFPDEEAWDLQEQQAGPPRPAPAKPPEEELEVDDPLWTLDLDPDAPPPQGKLCNCVLVRLRDRSSVAEFEGGEMSFEQGERVVVETEQGQTVGCVARRSYRTLADGVMPRLIRRIDHNDMRQEARNAVREREAFALCKERIHHRKLPMKLIRVEYLHGGNKAIFYFAAEHRVDFRDLVKDLAQRLHTRIVMRQVGVRDEAKMTGGIGSCGMPLCCSGWLARFEPVSIRMAKDQNLVLNPQKVSGQCGRLKCCLTYEQLQYHEARRLLPKPGRTVRTPEGEGKVQEVDILRGIVRVSLPDGKIQSFDAAQVEAIAADARAPAKGQSDK
jgi:cell fate regulator YaaT (PSP1 superfamily)